MDLQEKYDRLDMNYDNLKEELEKVKKDYINSERAADAHIEKLEKENKELKEKLALTENDRDEREVKARDMMKENKELKYKINKFLRLYKKWHSDSLFDYVETLSYERY